MKFNRKLNKEQRLTYITVSEYAWGCVPIDVNWAIRTNTFKEMENKLLLSGFVLNEVAF